MLQNIDLNTGKDIIVIAKLIQDKDGTFEASPTDIYGAKNKEDATFEFLQCVVDIDNFLALYKLHKVDIKDEGDTLIEDPWGDFSYIYTFNKEVPLFCFKSITRKGKDDLEYVLDRTGRITSSQLEDFLKMRPIVEKPI